MRTRRGLPNLLVAPDIYANTFLRQYDAQILQCRYQVTDLYTFPKATGKPLIGEPFRFLDLPPELRLIIYGYAMTELTRTTRLQQDSSGQIFETKVMTSTMNDVLRYRSLVPYQPTLFSPITILRLHRDDHWPSMYHPPDQHVTLNGEPAICKVSRALRREALPVWHDYLTSSLMLDLSSNKFCPPGPGSLRTLELLNESYCRDEFRCPRGHLHGPHLGLTQRWLARRGNAELARITKLHVVQRISGIMTPPATFCIGTERHYMLLQIARRGDSLTLSAPCYINLLSLQSHDTHLLRDILLECRRDAEVVDGHVILKVAARLQSLFSKSEGGFWASSWSDGPFADDSTTEQSQVCHTVHTPPAIAYDDWRIIASATLDEAKAAKGSRT